MKLVVWRLHEMGNAIICLVNNSNKVEEQFSVFMLSFKHMLICVRLCYGNDFSLNFLRLSVVGCMCVSVCVCMCLVTNYKILAFFEENVGKLNANALHLKVIFGRTTCK